MSNQIPTQEQYLAAKEITNVYEASLKAQHQVKLNGFNEELKSYFGNNLLDDRIKLIEYYLKESSVFRGSYEIIPVQPCIEEGYEGGNNADIDEMAIRHGINASFVYWMYHK